MSSTESNQRANQVVVHRLMFAVLDILTGVTEASVIKDMRYNRDEWTFHVKKASQQDA